MQIWYNVINAPRGGEVHQMAGNGKRKGEFTLILSLAQGMSVPQAASAAGMGERTAYKRLEDQDVQDRINELRQELFKEAVRQLAASCSLATTTLQHLLNAESEMVRLGAARTILEMANKLRTTVLLEDRLTDMERKYHELAEADRGVGAGGWPARIA